MNELLKTGDYLSPNSKGGLVAGGLCVAPGTTFHNKGRHADNVTNGTISEKETIGISCRTHGVGVDGCEFWARSGVGARKAPEYGRLKSWLKPPNAPQDTVTSS